MSLFVAVLLGVSFFSVGAIRAVCCLCVFCVCLCLLVFVLLAVACPCAVCAVSCVSCVIVRCVSLRIAVVRALSLLVAGRRVFLFV